MISDDGRIVLAGLMEFAHLICGEGEERHDDEAYPPRHCTHHAKDVTFTTACSIDNNELPPAVGVE